MNDYIKTIPDNPSFAQNGLKGYKYNIETNTIGVYYIDCFKGHDKYCINTESTHIYHILSGEGRFCIENEIFTVQTGDVIEVPPNKEFVYAGEMRLMLVMSPDFNVHNNKDTKENNL